MNGNPKMRVWEVYRRASMPRGGLGHENDEAEKPHTLLLGVLAASILP